MYSPGCLFSHHPCVTQELFTKVILFPKWANSTKLSVDFFPRTNSYTILQLNAVFNVIFIHQKLATSKFEFAE